MKITKKILKVAMLASPIICSFIGSSITSCNKINTLNNSDNWIPAKFWVTEEIDAKVIGAEKGTFTIKHRTGVYHESKLIDISSSFLVEKDHYDFNNGEFDYNNKHYKITEICDNVFSTCFNWFFINTHITFPATITKIDSYAFSGNSRNTSKADKEILSLTFNENLEEIGKGAFYKCNDLDSNVLKLPNSLKRLGNDAFYKDYFKVIDLSALDHVINVDSDPLSSNGCFSSNDITKIYVKDQSIKNMYMSDKYWSSCANLFEVK